MRELAAHAASPRRARVAAVTSDCFIKLSPINRRRWANFRANKRGYWSFWIFLVLFVLSLFAEFIANDRPLVARVDGHWFVPVLADYAESDIIPDGLPTEAD